MQAQLTRKVTSTRRVVGLAPGNVQRDRGRRAHQFENRAAVLQLFVMSALARLGKASEARAAVPTPTKEQQREFAGFFGDQVLNVDVANVAVARRGDRSRPEPRIRFLVLLRDERVVDLEVVVIALSRSSLPQVYALVPNPSPSGEQKYLSQKTILQAAVSGITCPVVFDSR